MTGEGDTEAEALRAYLDRHPQDDAVATFIKRGLKAQAEVDAIIAGLSASYDPDPAREEILLALAQADLQDWPAIDVNTTRHTAETMYGAQADAVQEIIDARIAADREQHAPWAQVKRMAVHPPEGDQE